MGYRILSFLLGLLAGLGIAYGVYYFQPFSKLEFMSPITETVLPEKKVKPLQQYNFENLRERKLVASHITLEEALDETSSYTSYLFSFQTLGKKMTGQLNLPKNLTSPAPAIVMIRGYVDPSIYDTGTGTESAADVLAENGYITISPDFFGYGGSDPEPEDSWEARFVKPVNVLELIETIKKGDVINATSGQEVTMGSVIDGDKLGLWAHSNGGQIAISVLEVLSEPIPTTLWAPVTVPFPYSILYFGDELEDEGKVQRAWVALFERKYDAYDFSITQHLDWLTGPIQLHHGTNDDAALKWWSDEFVDKVETENASRAIIEDQSATESALPPVEIEYHVYPGADHNMRPSWDTVVQRDLQFFAENI